MATGAEYVGQAESTARYAARQLEHGSSYRSRFSNATFPPTASVSLRNRGYVPEADLGGTGDVSITLDGKLAVLSPTRMPAGTCLLHTMCDVRFVPEI